MAARRSLAELATGAAVLVVAAGFLVYALANTGRGLTHGTRLTAQFDNVGAITVGSEVRIAGVKVGSVTGTSVDFSTFRAVLTLSVQPEVKLPSDSSAVISSGGLLGGAFVSLTPGGADAVLQDGQAITITQSAQNLEDLLGKFIFNVGSLADAAQRSLRETGRPTGPGPQ